MAAPSNMTIRRGTISDAQAIRDVYLMSRMSAMPWLPVLYDLDEVTHWLSTAVIPMSHVFVAEVDKKIFGFASLKGDSLDHLYVLPDQQRHGLGTALLEAVKQDAGGRLRLYTFARNTLAKRFYERHGFREVSHSDGARNEEREPDILLELDIHTAHAV